MRQRRRKARVRAAHAQPAQCRARVSSVVMFINCLIQIACLSLSHAQRCARDDSLAIAGCPGRRGPVPLAGRALGRRSPAMGTGLGDIVHGRSPLVGLAARLGGWSGRGRGSMLRLGSTAASAT